MLSVAEVVLNHQLTFREHLFNLPNLHGSVVTISPLWKKINVPGQMCFSHQAHMHRICFYHVSQSQLPICGHVHGVNMVW